MFDHVAPRKLAFGPNKTAKYVGIALLAVGLGACAAGSGDSQQAAESGGIALLVLGFWHGLIAPLTLIVSAINEFASGALPWAPRMYQEGGGVIYDIGFFVGIIGGPSILWSGSLRRR
ncbi:MAG: hypothetical protein DCF16_16850 [Alphaproteobacteria bacterium]|nr:MAG: hypothetical protein DCF16_16850 [Alphaproteobacteria bacterium]